MSTFAYYRDFLQSYQAELDDLFSDSDGKNVLEKRLAEKRKSFNDILSMIEYSPEMVAVAFFNAFSFLRKDTVHQAMHSVPGDDGFPQWEDFAQSLHIKEWAQPLIAACLKTAEGNAFLVKTAVLEFLRVNASAFAGGDYDEADEHEESSRDRFDDEDLDDREDLGEAGGDWLSEQGFDPLTA